MVLRERLEARNELLILLVKLLKCGLKLGLPLVHILNSSSGFLLDLHEL
jgi:hypothetical protein